MVQKVKQIYGNNAPGVFRLLMRFNEGDMCVEWESVSHGVWDSIHRHMKMYTISIYMKE